MIELQVEDKCQNCDNFSPIVDRIDITCFGDESPQFQQNLYCRNKNFCKNLENYLEKTKKVIVR